LHLRLGGLALSEVTWVNDTTITGKLPTTLPPGRHDLWVVNPGGQIGVLGNAVIVGKQLYLPAMARP
jgi:hypothetical protein